MSVKKRKKPDYIKVWKKHWHSVNDSHLLRKKIIFIWNDYKRRHGESAYLHPPSKFCPTVATRTGFRSEQNIIHLPDPRYSLLQRQSPWNILNSKLYIFVRIPISEKTTVTLHFRLNIITSVCSSCWMKRWRHYDVALPNSNVLTVAKVHKSYKFIFQC